MSKIWVLGAGQLGAMLHYSGLPLGLDVRPIDIESQETLDIDANDIVTAEREKWPETAATNQLASHPNFVNKAIFARLADRLTQKQILDDLGIATTPWCAVEDQTKTQDLHQNFGSKVLLKRRTGGYDGRGQHWIDGTQGDDIPADWRNESIAEKKIPFEDEVSVVGVRNAAGKMTFFPLALNLHLGGILMGSLAQVKRIEHLQSQGEAMLGKLMQGLDYVGVMAMECFRIGDELMVNEVAPRVHNSGHWTMSGASISQFEYHLRAIADLAIPKAIVKGPTAMVNLIGTEHNLQWMDVPGAELYWYRKAVRAGRKVGHINFTNNQITQLDDSLAKVEKTLPEDYGEVIDWLRTNLA